MALLLIKWACGREEESVGSMKLVVENKGILIRESITGNGNIGYTMVQISDARLTGDIFFLLLVKCVLVRP